MSNVTLYEAPEKPLSAAEGQRLEQLEGVVRRGAQTFVEVGNALVEIKERKLYRNEERRTFEQYCKEVFDFSKSYASRQIKAAAVFENVANWQPFEGEVIDLKPANESQVRPLYDLPAEQQRIVWKMATETAPDGKITASHVNKTARQYLGKERQKRMVRAKEHAAELKEDLSKMMREALDSVAAAVSEERLSGYKTSKRQAIVDYLDALRQVVAEDGVLIEDRAIQGAANDANKLEKAGFSLFRMDDASMNIKIRGGGGWPKHSGPYPTKTAMQQAFVDLLKDSKNLAG